MVLIKYGDRQIHRLPDHFRPSAVRCLLAADSTIWEKVA